jgi:acyl carrier protein
VKERVEDELRGPGAHEYCSHAGRGPSRRPDAQEIRTWLVSAVAAMIRLDPQDIGLEEPFDAFGLVSRDAVMLSGDLGDWLGRRLPPTLLYDYPNIEALVRHLAPPSEDADAFRLQDPDHMKVAHLPGHLLAMVESLSEAEVEALLEQSALKQESPREEKRWKKI